MRLSLLLTLAACAAGSLPAQTVRNIKDTIRCPNSPDGRQPYRVEQTTSGDLRKVVITGANAVCNDGSPAIMYVRAARPGATEPDGPSANRWLIHLLGGGNCNDYEECAARWCGIGQWEGTLMTSVFSGEFRSPGGIMNRNAVNRLGDRNLVLIKYCSSDNWMGRKSDSVFRSTENPDLAYSLHMQGANIFSAAISQLEQGVSGLPKLTDATDVLLSGDSAGATGARQHLDRLAARLRAANPNTRVRGQFEATFNPDLNGKQGFPAGDPRDPVYARSTAEFNRIHVEQRNSLLDDSCLAAHPDARYLCVDDGYLALNHLTTPFFQMIDFQDPLMFNGFRDAGVSVTQAQFAQRLFDQTTELLQIRNTAVDRAQMTQAPGAGGRNCAVHVMYGDDDGYLGKRLRSGPNATAYSYFELLWNWLHGLTPSAVLSPRPADSPENPPEDSVCTARAASAPAQPAIATASSASYDFAAPLAPESIVVTFGSNLASASATATTIPWPTTLGGTQVIVTDSRGAARQAPIYYVSPGQIMYLIPAGTALGTARIAIGQQQLSVEIAATSPAIYSASATGKGVAAASYIRVTARGVRTDGLVFNPETVTAVPIPAAAGDQIFLILYGTGLRGGTATATVGEVSVPVAGPVAQGTYPGLDQINLGPLPLRIGAGSKQVVIRQGDRIANIVTVTFQAAP